MKDVKGVKLPEFVEEMELKEITSDTEYEDTVIRVPDVNRPALQFAGFFDYFDNDRLQVIGRVESEYLNECSPGTRLKKYQNIFEIGIPCIIYCKGIIPQEDVQKLAKKYNTPLFSTEDTPSVFMGKAFRWLNIMLAPCKIIHGVLVDIYGEGVLIMGESGIGKSETALELIQRGHRIVTDDAVEIRKINNDTLIGQAPPMTKHLIEIRGIGIIDIKMLFGVQSVKDTEKIDLVIKIEDWKPDKSYERLGLEDEFEEIMGNKVVCRTIPVRPGRNLAVILEAAAINHRQKKMGYNAAEELYKRLREVKEQEEDY